MRIYEIPGSPNPTRVRIALAEKGLMERVSFVTVAPPAGERHRNAMLLVKHPHAMMPILMLDDGTCIGECTAITEYLDHLDGRPTLTGQTPLDRTLVKTMQRCVEAGLLDALAAHSYHAQGVGSKTPQAAKWNRQRGSRVLTSMHYLDSVLSERLFLAGDHFSMADITAFAALAFDDFVRIERPRSLPHLTAWCNRVAVRPSIVATRSSR